MSEENTPKETNDKTGSSLPKNIFLVSYPKIVFMYPTVIVAAIVAIWMHITYGLSAENPVPTDSTSVFLATMFMAVFTFNLVVISFDFPRTTSLTLFFFVVVIVLGGYVMFTNYPNVLPAISSIFTSVRPAANAQFYYTFVLIFLMLFVLVKIGVQFDYWEVRPNELLHHHGFLSDMERFSAPSLRIDKEINDLFEYLLLGSGRLILHPSNERRAIVLENVFFIGNKEKTITRMLGALQVQVREDSN